MVDFEKARRRVAAESVTAIQRALETAGVEFTNGDAPGVRLRAPARDPDLGSRSDQIATETDG